MSLLVRERRPRIVGAGNGGRRLGALEQERSYWASRAPTFSKLEWASRQEYLRAVVKAGDLRPTDVVLDAGTGTGLIARTAAPHVARVTGIDISPEMMDGLQKHHPPNCEFIVGDIRRLDFSTGCFSKVFARMVFHSLMDETGHAARECHRVLQAGGRFILSEGIPPAKFVGEWYTQMFRLKEQRLTFFPDTLEALLTHAGFVNVRATIHVSPHVSIRNWLENSGLPPARQAEIMQRHREMPPAIRKAYRATFTNEGDVCLDMKFAIVVGTKPG